MIVFDFVIELLDWLFDRKSYKKKTILSLKLTGAIFLVALLGVVIAFIVLFVFYLRQRP